MASTLTIKAAEGNWSVRAGGAILAESKNALELREAGHEPVIYFPREDIAMAFLDESKHATACPLKGTASYFSIITKSKTIENAAWSYEAPAEGAAAIKGYLAFYASDEVKVERI